MPGGKIKRPKSRENHERTNERLMGIKWYPTEEPSIFDLLDAPS